LIRQSVGASKANPEAVTRLPALAGVPPEPPHPASAAASATSASLRALERGKTTLATKRKDFPSMAKTKDKVTDAAGTVKPYFERALRDEDLRDDLKSAFDSARTVYYELLGGRGVLPVATRVATDKEIQDELKSAIADLRKAADRVQGKEDHGARNSTLLIAGIALGILFNPLTGPQTRKFITDRVFGGGDDFTYQGSGGNGGNKS
jgi:hypothetical protein